MPVMLFFVSIVLTCALSGFLTVYAWRQRNVPGSRAYAGLALGECLLALAEILSMLSATPAQALFWFQVRFLPMAVAPVFWLVFALEYSGRRDWLSKRLLAGMFVVPVITQILLWSNHLYGLWVRREAGLTQTGAFWIADIGTRIPGPGFLIHSFYSVILLLASIVLLLITAWRMRRQYRRQALLAAGAGCTAFVFAIIAIFNPIPHVAFNLFTPGIGLSVLLIALAAFRFQLLKHAPAAAPGSAALQAQSSRALALFLLIFAVMAAGITATAYVSYQGYEQRFRHQAEDQLSSIAALKVDELQVWRKERLGDAEILDRNPAFAALVQRTLAPPTDAQAQAELQVWLDRYQAYGQYDRVFLLDAAGVERLSAPATAEPVAAHLTQEVAAALSAGQVTFADFHRDTDDGPIHLALLVPIFDGQDGARPLGLLVLRIDPHAYLYPSIQQWPVPTASAETLLIRREGADALFLNELRFQTGTALNLRFPLENTQLPAVKAALGQEGIVEGVDYRGAAVLAALRGVPDSPWFVVAKMDVAEVYAPLRERQWQTVAFFGALMTAFGAGLGLVWRQQRVRDYRGQVEAAQALRASEEKYSTLFREMLDGFALHEILCDEQGNPVDYRYLAVNPAFERLTGLKAQNIVGRTVLEALPGTERYWIETYGKVALTGEPAFFENYSAGLKKHFQVTAFQPAPNQFACIFVDITERKQAEADIRRLNERFSLAVRAARLGVWDWNVQKNELIWDDRMYELYGVKGVKREAFGGAYEAWLAGLHPDDRAASDELSQQARRGEKEYDTEFRIRWPDGAVRVLKAYGQVAWDAAGNPVRMTGINYDITERKQAEEALRESEKRFRTLFEQAAVGVALLETKTGRYVDINQRYCDFLGYTREEMLASQFQAVTHPDDVQTNVDNNALLIAGKIKEFSIEKRYIRKDGTMVWGNLTASPLWAAGEEPDTYFHIAVVQDITERKLSGQRAFELALERERMALLTKFINDVSHEFRTPLTIMQSNVYLLERLEDPVKRQRKLAQIGEQVTGITRLVELLVEMARLDSGVPFTLQPTDLNGWISAEAGKLQGAVAAKGLTLHLALAPDLPPVPADGNRLGRALHELLDNAVRFTPAGGNVTVRTAGRADGVTVEVQDSGPGIPPDVLPRIFERFYRQDVTHTTPGFGLGLPIARAIIERHGGRLEVESQPGAGSLFRIVLPGSGSAEGGEAP